MSLAARLRMTAPAPAAGGFNPETDITWHSLFWAEGTGMTAQGYSNGDPVGTWPNETAESDATEATNQPTYEASNTNLNSQPAVDFGAAGDFTKLVATSFTVDPSSPWSLVVIGDLTASASGGLAGGDVDPPRLRVGYNRAARMIETMEKEGVVGPADGSRPREVLARQSY